MQPVLYTKHVQIVETTEVWDAADENLITTYECKNDFNVNFKCKPTQIASVFAAYLAENSRPRTKVNDNPEQQGLVDGNVNYITVVMSEFVE